MILLLIVFLDTYFGKRILFSHRPQKDDGGFDINIHGHFHNNLNPSLENKEEKKLLSILTKKHKLLSIEENNYQPVLLEKFI